MEYIAALGQLDMFLNLDPADVVLFVGFLKKRVPMWVEDGIIWAWLADRAVYVASIHRQESAGEA